jgi:hypothetical protein
MTVIGWMLDGMAAFATAVAVSFAYTDVEKILNKVVELPLVQGQSVVAHELCPSILQLVEKLKNKQDEQDSSSSFSSRILPPASAPAFDLSSSSSSSSSRNDRMTTNDNFETSKNENDDYYSLQSLLQHPQTTQLGIMVQFAENCKRRQIMERSLLLRRRREEQPPQPGLFADDDDNAAAADSLSLKVSTTTSSVKIPAPGVPRDLPVDLFSSNDDDKDDDNDASEQDQLDDQDTAAAAPALDFYDDPK